MAEIILAPMQSPKPATNICLGCKVNDKAERRSYCNPCQAEYQRKRAAEKKKENELYGLF